MITGLPLSNAAPFQELISESLALGQSVIIL